jgi:hypothetical protein
VKFGKEREERAIGSTLPICYDESNENVSESEWQSVAELHLKGCDSSQLLPFEE